MANESAHQPSYIPRVEEWDSEYIRRPGGHLMTTLHQSEFTRILVRPIPPGAGISRHRHAACWDSFVGGSGRGYVSVVLVAGEEKRFSIVEDSILVLPPGLLHSV